eukprot:726024-Prymnesium_polylepis.2
MTICRCSDRCADRQLLLAGSSAGGLAAQIHADWIRRQLPTLETFKVISASGFFPQIRGGCSAPSDCSWMRSMRAVFTLHNSSASLNPECLAAAGWRCIFANETAPFVQTPVFLVQSGLDQWQLTNVSIRVRVWTVGGRLV